MTTLSAICYHYLERNDEFKRIWGHDFELFKKHIDFLANNFVIIEPKDLLKKNFYPNKDYMLLTFDDGLKEHVKMADYISSLGFKGIFSIPACILKNEPPNPQVLHFGMAYYGVRKFYSFIKTEIENNFSANRDVLLFDAEHLGLMELHQKIKNIFKFQLQPEPSRAILLSIFEKYIKSKFPNFIESIFLKQHDLKKLVEQGHALSVHTDTHPVTRKIKGSNALMEQEIVEAKKILSDLVGQDIAIFTHPFGGGDDIFEDEEYFKSKGYQAVLTTHKKNDELDLLHLGRYCTFSKDTTESLKQNLWKYSIDN